MSADRSSSYAVDDVHSGSAQERITICSLRCMYRRLPISLESRVQQLCHCTNLHALQHVSLDGVLDHDADGVREPPVMRERGVGIRIPAAAVGAIRAVSPVLVHDSKGAGERGGTHTGDRVDEG